MFRLFISCTVLCLVSAANVDKRLLINVAAGVKIGEIDDDHLDETSGICASRKHPGILYAHNDHGGHNRIYAINATNAKVEAVLTINGAENKDWEDIACGKCVGHMTDFCFYIGDIGDGGKPSAETIYRVQEPGTVTTQTLNVDAKLMYSWSESDADTLMLTPDAELYIISKVSGGHGLIAHIPSAGWGQGSPVPLASSTYLQHVTSTHKDPLGGDISHDGKEILIKMREQILHYTVPDGGDVMTVLSRETPYVMPYRMEKKGEGVAFSADGNSYYTLGEGDNEPLYRYAGLPYFRSLNAFRTKA